MAFNGLAINDLVKLNLDKLFVLNDPLNDSEAEKLTIDDFTGAVYRGQEGLRQWLIQT